MLFLISLASFVLCKRRSRAVATLLVMLGMCVTLAACGDVAFVPAALSPREIAVIYSEQEDVTLLRWRLSGMSEVDETTFELLSEGGEWRAIDFGTSVFSGGQVRCGDGRGRCAQFVIGGRYRAPKAATILRGRHPRLGLFPGGKAEEISQPLTLTFRAYFEKGNQHLYTEIVDAIGGDDLYRFPRPMQWGLWDRIAACVPGFHPPEVVFSAVTVGSGSVSPPALSKTGRYCVAARPMTTGDAPGTETAAALDTWPEIKNGNHTFQAPVAVTPFSYQIVLDLTIPVVDRCVDTITAIEKTIDNTLSLVTSTRKLPTVNLGEDPSSGSHCHGRPERTLEAIDLADAVKAAGATWPELHQRFHVLYFNNLQAPLPDPLTASIGELWTALAAPPVVMDRDAQFWMFGLRAGLGAPSDRGGPSERGGTELETRTFPWLSAPDPDFDKWFLMTMREELPLASEVHDPDEPVPLLTAAEAGLADGGFIRICRQSVAPSGGGGVRPVHHDARGRLVPYPTGTLTWPVEAQDPPAYLVDFPRVVRVPKGSLKAHTLRLSYELCERYCDHAFTSAAGVSQDSWLDSTMCVNASSEDDAGAGL